MSNQYIQEKVEEFEKKLGGFIATQSKRETQDKDNEWFRTILDATYTKAKLEVLEELARRVEGKRESINVHTVNIGNIESTFKDVAIDSTFTTILSEIAEMKKNV